MFRAAPRIVAVLACVTAFSAIAPSLAAAQTALPNMPMRGEGQAKRGRGTDGPPPDHPAPALSTAVRVPWPRLDPGALICKTRDDLRMQAEVIQARSDGTRYSGPTPNCRTVNTLAAIDILTRESPSATEVKLRDAPGGTGWTNTWLPSQPPR